MDVFAKLPLSGNPLAVVEGADALSDDVLRRIAREFNQAETTFVMRSVAADWKLRSFTASGAEVFGAGHNALGAWLWLGYRRLLRDLAEPTAFRQEIGGEVLPITLYKRDGRIHGSMKQSSLKLLPPLNHRTRTYERSIRSSRETSPSHCVGQLPLLSQLFAVEDCRLCLLDSLLVARLQPFDLVGALGCVRPHLGYRLVAQ